MYTPESHTSVSLKMHPEAFQRLLSSSSVIAKSLSLVSSLGQSTSESPQGPREHKLDREERRIQEKNCQYDPDKSQVYISE